MVEGKTYTAACLAARWVLDPAHKTAETICIVVAPTHRQITLGVISHLRDFRKRRIIPGRISAGTSPVWNLDGRDVMVGMSPPRGSGGFLQGIHAKNLLLIFDEAAEIEQGHWDAGVSQATAGNNRVLAIGNPTIPDSPFHSACEGDESDKWNVIRMPVSSYPAFTGEPVSEIMEATLPSRDWVDLMRSVWPPAQQCARLDAEFPSAGSLAIFDMTKFRKAERQPPLTADCAGVDVAGEGRDQTAVYLHHRAERVVWELPVPREYQTGDQLALSSWLAPKLAEYGVGQVMVDGLGPGSELAPVLQRRMPDAQVACVMTGDTAYDPGTYANRRAELHWAWATRPPTLLNPDPRVLEEFRRVRADLNERRRKVEKKDLLRERLGRSPDRLDAALLAVAPAPDMEVLVV